MTVLATSLPGVVLLGPAIEHRDVLQTMIAPHATAVRWVPDSRTFLRSQTAGGPLERVVPAGAYAASLSYLENYPAILRFTSPQELCARLADRDTIAQLRETAWRSRGCYTAEAQSHAMLEVLSAVLSC